MQSRERVLVAMDGGEPDRIPCALSFYRVEIEKLAPPDQYREDWIDVQFVRFTPSPEEEAWYKAVRPHPPDTRLGTFDQVATYTRWHYEPQSPEHRNPLACARTLDDLRDFPFPEFGTFNPPKGLWQQVRALHLKGLAAGGNLPHLGGELFETAWRLRGLENFLLDMIERPAWAHLLLDRLTAFACRNVKALAHANIDVLALDDDIGMPGTMMISPPTWRAFFKPRLAHIIRAAREVKPDLRILFHSDGYFEPIIEDLVEIGVQAINPLQPEYMDAAHIRRRFGPTLALWGIVGRQTTFSQASPAEIRQEVQQHVETLGRRGLILCPAYDIDEPDIPWENIAAFLEAVRAL